MDSIENRVKESDREKAILLAHNFTSVIVGHKLYEMELDPSVGLLVHAIATEDYEDIITKVPGIKAYYGVFAQAVALGAFLQSQGLIDFEKCGQSTQ